MHINWKYVSKQEPSADARKCLVAINKNFGLACSAQVDVAMWSYSAYHGRFAFLSTDQTQWMWEDYDIYAWAEWPDPPELE